MSDIIKKLREKKKKDPAHMSEAELAKREKEILEDATRKMDEKEKREQKTILFLQKELKKYSKDKKELLKLKDEINDRFKVSSTNTNAAIYGIASLYYDALEVNKIPEDYYPHTRSDAPDFFITPEDEHYWLWNFQINTQDNDGGHTIPERPGTNQQYVIHGFLFPMTSTTIYLGKFNYDQEYGIIYYPNDELFGGEFMEKYKETYYDDYETAYKNFLEVIDNHLEDYEERYYEKKQNL